MHTQYVSDIRETGYTTIPSLFDMKEVGKLKNLLLKHDVISNDINQFIYNLQNKELYFYTLLIRQPVLKSILLQCLNDEWYKQLPADKANFILRGLVARNSGTEPLKLHLDSFVPNCGDYIWNMVILIVLEPCNKENGSTYLVPGSHKFGRYASQDWVQHAHSIEAQPGDVVIFDSRTWHGANKNTSGKTRWSINATFSRWWIKQSYDIARAFPEKFLPELTDEEQSILGFCNVPPLDENEKVNIQSGYESLPDTSY